MALYRKKPITVQALTFNEFIKYGEGAADNLVNGVPWSFKINDQPITHENDKCYIIVSTRGTHYMTPDDMLIIGIRGEVYPCEVGMFKEMYERV